MKGNTKIMILRGNSGSGKSTVARQLQRQLGRGTLLISQDMIRREMLWVRDGEGTKAISLLAEMVRYGRQNCDFVILEGILYADWYRELFETIVSEYGSDIYAYYYDLTFEETLRRHQTKPNCNDFGEEDMRRWWRDKDYIGFIAEKGIDSKMTEEEAVEMILSDIGITA